MSDAKITQVMMDDSTLDVSKEVGMVFSIANTLRGPYRADKYKDVIIPMIIIRRLECAMQLPDETGRTRQQRAAEAYAKNPKTPKQVLESLTGYPFYNTSTFTLRTLLDEAPSIVENFNFYIDSFSPNIQDILADKLKFKEEITKLDKNNRLLGVVKKFSELDLNPETIDGHKMGYMFEEIIRRFSENAEAGDHYTPREVIRLLSSVLLAEGADDLFGVGKEITVLDMACGSGGMLSTTHDFIKRMNPDATVRLFGQENNPESYSICLADMLIKDQSAENIRYADTMKEDCFEEQSMRFVIANPPFGQAWGGKDAADGVEKSVRDEYKKGSRGRFGAGLPSQLFYNTDIGIYAFILSKNKEKKRKGKVQLIDAADMWEPLKKSLGKKRREISKAQIGAITRAYAAFSEGKTLYPSEHRKEDGKAHLCRLEVKIFDREEFLYKEYAVYQPLQRRGVINEESIEALRTSAYFTANANLFNEVDFEELQQMEPREGKDEKKYRKYRKGLAFTQAVIEALKRNQSDRVYMDYAQFEAQLKEILKGIEGYSASRLKGIAMELTVMDKSAKVQKDKKGNIVVDPTTKDTEIIRLNQDPEEYMQREVLPHLPDAVWRYEYDPDKAPGASNKERLGAEFPFTRFFYEYHEPEKSDALLAQFMEIEAGLAEKIAALGSGV